MTAHSHIFQPPAQITRPLLIEAAGLQIDADGTYCTETGALTAVHVDGRTYAPATVAACVRTLYPDEPCMWLLGLGAAELNEAIVAANEYWRFEE